MADLSSFDTAAEIAAQLGGVREGREWRCECPGCGGHNLTLRVGDRVPVLVKCFTGCHGRDVLRALREEGLLEAGNAGNRAVEVDKIAELTSRIREAQNLYRKSLDAQGTLVERYLRLRGITVLIPAVLRFVGCCPHRNGRYFPAMVAPVVNVDGGQIGCHATFLQYDGKFAFQNPKDRRECRGAIAGGAVRLADHDPDRELIVGEGIETTISAMQIFDLPGWAALSTSGVTGLDLPPEIRRVVLAVDNDDAGREAAKAAYYRWKSEGRLVRLSMPPHEGDDFNDVLRAGVR
jgi:hypothetical protein